MKRLLCILLLLSLPGCVATPSVEYVSQKNESRAAVALAASAAEAVHFPDRWDETVETHAGKVTFCAAIEQKADGVYPVCRTEDAAFSQEDVTRILSALLPAPVSYGTGEPTKAELTERFRDFLLEVDRQRAGEWYDDTYWSDEEVESLTQTYLDEIAAAPDERAQTPVSNYRSVPMNEPIRYALSDGGTAAVKWNGGAIHCSIGGEGIYDEPQYRSDLRLGEPTAAIWQSVKLAREDAEAMLWEALSDMGLSGFATVEAYPANLTDFGPVTHSVATGWRFLLHRDCGGYPPLRCTAPTDRFSYGESAGYSRPIREESIEVFVAADGLKSFAYCGPKAVVGLEAANATLLPFDEVRRLACGAFSVGLAAADAEVYRIVLTTATLRIKDSDQYRETPCWYFFFDTRQLSDEFRFSPVLHHEALLLNALDGTLVHPQSGY